MDKARVRALLQRVRDDKTADGDALARDLSAAGMPQCLGELVVMLDGAHMSYLFSTRAEAAAAVARICAGYPARAARIAPVARCYRVLVVDSAGLHLNALLRGPDLDVDAIMHTAEPMGDIDTHLAVDEAVVRAQSN
jgi:hypothetical protein